MDKKINLDENTTNVHDIKLDPTQNKTTVTLNKAITINQPKPPKFVTNNSQIKITQEIKRKTTNYIKPINEIDEEDEEDDDDELEEENKDNKDNKDNNKDNEDDNKDSKDDKPDEQKNEPEQKEDIKNQNDNQVENELKDNAKDKVKENAKQKAKKEANKQATKQAAKKAGSKAAGSAAKGAASSGAAAGGAAAGGAAAGGAAAGGAAGAAAAGGTAAAVGGTIAGGWILLIIFGVILLICVIAALLVTIFGGNMAAAETNVTKYGEQCDTINVINAGKYNGEVQLEQYVAGVIAAEYDDIPNYEFYKFAAVVVRTHVQKEITDSCEVSGDSSFQKYKNVSESENSYLIQYAVNSTYGVVLTKSNNLIDVHNTKISCSDCIINKTKANELIQAGKNYDDLVTAFYGNNVDNEKNNVTLTGAQGFVNPTKKINCTSPYGEREINGETEFHTGIDIGFSTDGADIYATKEGVIKTVVKTVTRVNGEKEDGYGNYIVIEHYDGSKTLYAHMKYGSIPNKIVQNYKVSQGEVIGQIGSTGYSTGYHLHYEVIKNGSNVDPSDYMDLSKATGVCIRED